MGEVVPIRQSSEVVNFDFDGIALVRVVELDGEPWFVAKDVTDVLGFKDGSRAVRDHVLPGQTNRADRPVAIELGQVGGQLPALINESGLYRLIMRSNVPGATRFQAWVTDEVLPTIRKTGGAYVMPSSQAEIDLSNPDTMLDKFEEVLSIARDQRAKVLELEARNAELAPKADLAERAFDLASELISRREAARTLSVPQQWFNSLLRGWNWFELNTNAAKAYAVNQGYAENKQFVTTGGRIESTGYLTSKGLQRAHVKILELVGE